MNGAENAPQLKTTSSGRLQQFCSAAAKMPQGPNRRLSEYSEELPPCQYAR